MFGFGQNDCLGRKIRELQAVVIVKKCSLWEGICSGEKKSYFNNKIVVVVVVYELFKPWGGY